MAGGWLYWLLLAVGAPLLAAFAKLVHYWWIRRRRLRDLRAIRKLWEDRQ